MAPNSTSTALSMKAKTWRRIESSERVMSAARRGLFAFRFGGGALVGAARAAHAHRRAVGEEARTVGGDRLADGKTLDHLLHAVLPHAGFDHALARDAVLDRIHHFAGGPQHHALLRH